MKLSSALVSIITVNYNQTAATLDLLDNCLSLTWPNLEIIVVDNASKKDPSAMIKSVYPGVITIRNDENLGFAGGNNRGIELARGEFILLLNNDTSVTPDLIEHLLAGFGNDETIGVVCPKILYAEPPETIQFAGYTPINPFTGRNRTIGQGKVDSGKYNVARETPYAHGAAMMIRKSVVEKVGMMPEAYFLYYEELDWSAKIKKSGYRIVYYPAAYVVHQASLSVGQNSPLKTYYYYRNRILFMRRNYSFFERFVFSLFVLFVTTPKTLFVFIIKGQWNHIGPYFKALAWHIRNPRLPRRG